MDGGFVFIEIVIFAMIAAFLVYRLRSVLGRRNGEERQRPNPFAAPPVRADQPSGDNIVRLPERARTADPASPGEPQSLAAVLAQIQSVDPGFDEKRFLEGAKAAFGIVVEAFAKSDTATLRPLLSDDVYDNFSTAIRERQAAGDTLETRLDRVREADIIEARLDGRSAFVTVKFVTDQMNVTRNSNGVVVDGDPARVVEVVDIWTFARNTRSRDPNWALVETRVPN